jgi:hypothetical protein
VRARIGDMPTPIQALGVASIAALLIIFGALFQKYLRYDYRAANGVNYRVDRLTQGECQIAPENRCDDRASTGNVNPQSAPLPEPCPSKTFRFLSGCVAEPPTYRDTTR